MRIKTEIDEKVVKSLPHDAKKHNYKKMMKDYKKQLVKNAKETRPWDYGWLLEAIVLNLRFMKTYYTIGHNVISEDKNNTRLKICTELLDAYDEMCDVHEKYNIYHKSGGIKNGKGIIVDGRRTDWWVERKFEDVLENSNAEQKEYNMLRDKFFKQLSDNLEELWD